MDPSQTRFYGQLSIRPRPARIPGALRRSEPFRRERFTGARMGESTQRSPFNVSIQTVAR